MRLSESRSRSSSVSASQISPYYTIPASRHSVSSSPRVVQLISPPATLDHLQLRDYEHHRPGTYTSASSSRSSASSVSSSRSRSPSPGDIPKRVRFATPEIEPEHALAITRSKSVSESTRRTRERPRSEIMNVPWEYISSRGKAHHRSRASSDAGRLWHDDIIVVDGGSADWETRTRGRRARDDIMLIRARR